MSGLKNVRNRRDDSLSRVKWDDFESLLATYYCEQGFDVEHIGTGATKGRFDGGIDLKLRKDDQYILVQCKHWNAKQVPHNAVHELLGIMVNRGATGAILVTSGEFTKAAIEAATRQGHVQLIDGGELRAMLGPIDEPPRALTSDFLGAARPMVAHVGERLLLATEDRIRGNRRSQSDRFAKTALSLLVLKAVVPLVLMLGVMFLGWSMLKHAIVAMQPVASVHVQPAPLPAPSVAQAQSVTEMPAAQGAASIRQMPIKPMSAAERREQKRRQEEELRQLKENTPEM
jgi:hypothetical protein